MSDSNVLEKLSINGIFDDFDEIGRTSWTGGSLFDIPVPSFSIKIFHSDRRDSYSGTLYITSPNGKTSDVKEITYNSAVYLSVCHFLITECYKRCFLPVLTNMDVKRNSPEVIEFKNTRKNVRKILDNCSKELLSKCDELPNGVVRDTDIIATRLINDMRTYDLYVKTFVNSRDNSISNIAICFSKHNDTTICRVYYCDGATFDITFKGGFCYSNDCNPRKQIYKSKLFGDNNEFWNMLSNEEFKSGAEYRYFKEVIKHMTEFEPNSSGWSSICFDDDVIYIQNSLGYISTFDLSSTYESQLVVDTGVDSKDLSSLLAKKLKTIKSYQYYPLLISSIFLDFDAKKEKEKENMIDAIKSNETNDNVIFGIMWDILYGNETINIDEL